MRVSVIIPVHNKGPRLRLALAGILGQASTDDAELILSADSPTAEVRDIISSVPNKRVVETPGLGRAAARNAGAACARRWQFKKSGCTRMSSSMNTSRSPRAQAECPGLVHGSLREIIGLLRVQDPAVGGPGCPAIDAAALSAGRWQPEKMRLVANPLEQAAEHPEAAQWPWLACAGANISVPRMLWEVHGGFDERYGTRWGVEDIDFAFRLWAAGVPITRAPTARGYHMSHYNATRWDEHNENLLYFQQRANCPEALALDALLSPNGSLKRYRLRVAQIRQHGSGVPACA